LAEWLSRCAAWHGQCKYTGPAEEGSRASEHTFEEDVMRIARFVPAAAVVALAACASAVQVRTALSPDASLSGLRTFRVQPTPKPSIASAQSTNDPMLVNSISNRALRADLQRGFAKLGYAVNDSTPDFCVAYYASTNQQLDITTYDYGYSLRPRWWRGWGPRYRDMYAPMVTQYTQGTVIVDVFDPKSKELLWRGQGVAAVSDNQEQYAQELQTTVAAILAKFPAAAPSVAQGQ
jgi:hypothetical protein